jgi:trk system potassium uptake protein TrkA
MRVIIVGCGRVGAYLAKALLAGGHEVTVVDRNTDSFKRLGEDFAGNVVAGTGIDEDILRRAGIDEADALVAVTNGDNTNIMAAQVAREVFGVKRVICRIYDPIRQEIYEDLGLEAICPTIIGAARIQEMLEAGAPEPKEQ